MATVDATEFFTFNPPLEKKPRDNRSVAITEADVAAFQLKVNDVDNTLFDAVTADGLKKAWPTITSWDVVWDDITFI